MLSITSNQDHLKVLLAKVKERKAKIQEDEKAYYNEEKDEQSIDQYYLGIDFENSSSDNIIQSLTELLRDTHTNHVGYNPSEYVYPWVDLQPDGKLISIYNGKEREPEEVMEEDYYTSLKRKKELKKVMASDSERLAKIESDLKFNCEHAVPQSWFDKQQPMRGDIHHLFTCEPKCNSHRSNYLYHDFADYEPEVVAKRIKSGCGKAEGELFEPEYGKGTVARAMLYFLIRYPKQIKPEYLKRVDTQLLMEWHQQFPPDLYEKHRNQAIYEIQGNRNPFIDFPEMMFGLF
ncbi:extracellular ribonuclease precursor [Bacillus freudenreichii]|nr:extracellular ribonuclease precursor [Bacillus freudenreichii]